MEKESISEGIAGVKSWLPAATMQGRVTVTILSGHYRIMFSAAKYCSNEPCAIVFAMPDEK